MRPLSLSLEKSPISNLAQSSSGDCTSKGKWYLSRPVDESSINIFKTAAALLLVPWWQIEANYNRLCFKVKLCVRKKKRKKAIDQ